MKSEEFVSEDNGCACCRKSLKVELLERADRLSVEVSVLSLREGRSRRLYLWCGTKMSLLYLVMECILMYCLKDLIVM